jgi:hypothetical protein
MRMRIVLGLALSTALQLACFCAQCDDSPSSPSDVVNEYLQLDSGGAEFTKEGRSKLQILNPKNIAVDYSRTMNTHVISGYTAFPAKIAGDIATTSVSYDVIGVATDDFFDFSPVRKKDTVNVRLRKYDGVWKIESEIWPHILAEVAAKRFEEVAGNAPNPERFRVIANRVRSAARSNR